MNVRIYALVLHYRTIKMYEQLIMKLQLLYNEMSAYTQYTNLQVIINL